MDKSIVGDPPIVSIPVETNYESYTILMPERQLIDGGVRSNDVIDVMRIDTLTPVTDVGASLVHQTLTKSA